MRLLTQALVIQMLITALCQAAETDNTLGDMKKLAITMLAEPTRTITIDAANECVATVVKKVYGPDTKGLEKQQLQEFSYYMSSLCVAVVADKLNAIAEEFKKKSLSPPGAKNTN